MTEKKLLESLSRLGLPMMAPTEELDVNETLAEVVRSRDTRLWESFPVLLVNASETYGFSPEHVKQRLATKKEKKEFQELVLLSGAAYLFYHVAVAWWDKHKKTLTKKDLDTVKSFRDRLAHNQTLKCSGANLDPERLMSVFDLYHEKKSEKNRQRHQRHAELSLEYALSQIFSPKQKELFKRKLEGAPLTKTEREYYSRTVKKKVAALANSELHGLSKKLMGV